MYNTDFLAQMDEFRRYLFGNVPTSPVLPFEDVHPLAQVRLRGHGQDDMCRYMPPREIKMLPCHEDANGEWVPDASALSEGEVPL
jgi:hypothetical protein